MKKCIACGRELTTDLTMVEGIGPVCRAKLLVETEKRPSKICAYEVEFIDKEKIVLIHERSDPKHPTISLTNCIEYVINKIVKEYGICTSLWTFVENSSYHVSSNGYDEYDIVDITGEDVDWHYLWHSDAKDEKETLSKGLIIERVNRYRQAYEISGTTKT